MLRPSPKKPDGSRVLGRRAILRSSARSRGSLALTRLGVGLGAGAAGCGGPPVNVPRAPETAAAAERRRLFQGPVAVWSFFDLPDDLRSHELSGASWEESTRTLWAVQDERANIVAIKPDHDMKTWTLDATLRLDLRGPLDLEGLAVKPDGFYVCSEVGPRVIELDRQGRWRRDVAPPSKFSEAIRNKSFESLSLTPDRAVLYTTSETALPRDERAAGTGIGPHVRIVRLHLASGELSEHAYATDVVVTGGGDYGISDLVAISTNELLVLERGWTKGVGNTCRIYRVSVEDSTAICQGVESLEATGPVLRKQLFVDLEALPATNCPPAKQHQVTPLMENYEGITIGPRLPDGRASLILVSDDNGRPVQTSRILILAVG